MSFGMPSLPTFPPRAGGRAPFDVPKNVIRTGEQALWSAYYYADAFAVAQRTDTLFAAQQGQVAQGWPTAMSYAETNMQEASRIPGGQAYDVYAIAVQPYYVDNRGLVRAELANLQNHAAILWSFLQTVIDVAPIQLIGSGGGIYGDTADTGAAEGGAGGSRVALNNGPGHLWVYQNNPVILPAHGTFNIFLRWGANALVIDGGAGNSALSVRVVLLGMYQSAIPVG